MLLTEYFNNSIKKNETFQRGCWAPLYYGVVSKIINDNSYNTYCEIGIGYGTHIKNIFINKKIEKIFIVDPMKFYLNDQFVNDIVNKEPDINFKTINNDNKISNFNQMFYMINNYLDDYKEKYTWFRKESLKITNNDISDNSLDCIFIDGDHSYDAVLGDLNLWWKKLKVNGTILGDDYWMKPVERAVNEFSNNINQSPIFLSNNINASYKIYSFRKLS